MAACDTGNIKNKTEEECKEEKLFLPYAKNASVNVYHVFNHEIRVAVHHEDAPR